VSTTQAVVVGGLDTGGALWRRLYECPSRSESGVATSAVNRGRVDESKYATG
jgi:hypothetical protein